MKIILKILKSLLNILVLTTLIICVFTWSTLSEEKRYQLVQKLEVITPFSIFELSTKIKSTIKSQIENSDNEFVKEASSLLSNSTSNEFHLNFVDFNCSLPETKQLQETKNHKIFQWKDDKGRIHFSDSSNVENAQDISQQYQSRKQFITLNIQAMNAQLPLDLDNKIHLSNTKMFLVLSDALRIEQLHQLEISIKIFGQADEFQLYLNQKAPSLKQAIGFYLAKDNEASVLMQKNPEQTIGLIRHESSHVMMANLYGLSPIWLNEGFAEYFQGLKISGLETSVYPNQYHLKLLQQAHKTGELSLPKHLGLSIREWQSQNVEQHYAEAWSIVYFLLSIPKNKNLLSEYFSQMSKDRCLIPDATVFFNKNYLGGLQQMDVDWKEWLSQSEIKAQRY